MLLNVSLSGFEKRISTQINGTVGKRATAAESPTVCIDNKQREAKKRKDRGEGETSTPPTEFNNYKTAAKDPFGSGTLEDKNAA